MRLHDLNGDLPAIHDRLFGNYAALGDDSISWARVGETVPQGFVEQIFVPVVGLYSLGNVALRSSLVSSWELSE